MEGWQNKLKTKDKRDDDQNNIVHENLYEKMALNVTGESKAKIVHENPT